MQGKIRLIFILIDIFGGVEGGGGYVGEVSFDSG